MPATRIPIATAVTFLLGACSSPPDSPETTAMFTEFQDYERFMGRWSRQLAPQLVRFSGVRDGDRVLDVGTGTGALAFAILESNSPAAVTGIDLSANYIQYASDQSDDPRLSFEVGDAQALNLPDDFFDRSMSLLVVNFIPDAGKAVREMRRVTRPGGVVSAAVWDYSEGMEMLRIFWDEVIALDPSADPKDERHMPYCREQELIQLWSESGLDDVESASLTIEQHFESFHDFWSPFLLGTGPAGAYVASLDPDRQEALRERLQQRIAAEAPGRPFVLRARAWGVRGTVR